jgi:hypothetical protein
MPRSCFIAIVVVLVPASIVTLASDPVAPRLPKTCETGEIVALRSAAYRGPTAPGIAEDQFRLAVAIEEAARQCPTGKEDGLHEAYGWYGRAGANNHAEAAYRAALYEMDRHGPRGGLAFLYIAASNGHAAAQARIAICHLKGVGVERNVSYGLPLLVRAAVMKLGVLVAGISPWRASQLFAATGRPRPPL